MSVRALYDWFHRTTRGHAGTTALEVKGHSLTYTELAELSGCLAALVERTAGGPPARVGLLMSRSVAAYAGYLAALRLGATVVPLDPRSPAARNAAITRAAGVEVTITDVSSGHASAAYARTAGVPVVDLAGTGPRAVWEASRSPRVPSVREPLSEVAYIAFTSGSTGKPKGVPVTHANVSCFLEEALPRFGFEPGCRVSQTFELSFDAAVNELFGAWAGGGTLCVPRRSEIYDVVRFANERGLSHWLSVPSVITFAVRAGGLTPGSVPGLRQTLFGGEPLTNGQALTWRAAAPNTTLHNCYGPTELTLVCTDFVVHPGDPAWPLTSNGTLPIGPVYPALEYVLIDDGLRPAEEGELCVRGPQRFPGYLDPDENTGRFMTFDGISARVYDGAEPLTAGHWYRTGDQVRRENGHLVHVGRVDDQIKVQGIRIEPGEIESLLRGHPKVLDAVVLSVAALDGEARLHAFYTGEEVGPAELAPLVAGLPRPMRPVAFHHRGSLPLTLNGKTDRKVLRAELAV
ncbi:AMP-binding protein [Sphaerisporangium viridialbum]|uniref:AMP-binding protein n=1 Tax=Sphaerisporangium viridialbum TaxID=46189 RepID=UPI003C717E52